MLRRNLSNQVLLTRTFVSCRDLRPEELLCNFHSEVLQTIFAVSSFVPATETSSPYGCMQGGGISFVILYGCMQRSFRQESPAWCLTKISSSEIPTMRRFIWNPQGRILENRFWTQKRKVTFCVTPKAAGCLDRTSGHDQEDALPHPHHRCNARPWM